MKKYNPYKKRYKKLNPYKTNPIQYKNLCLEFIKGKKTFIKYYHTKSSLSRARVAMRLFGWKVKQHKK